MADIVSIIGFRADTSDFKRGEKDLQGFTKAQKDVESQGRRTSDAIAGIGAALKGLAIGVAVRELLELVDAYKNLNAQIGLVTDSELERERALSSLTALAADNGQAIASLATTYAQLARSSDALGLSQTEILRTTEALSNAIIASGATAQEASAGLIQLSQGLASGALRGDELRSVMEQLPRVATALSAGLNVSIGELRKLGEEGAITTQAVIAALKSQFDALKSEADEIPDTFERAMTRLRNSLIIAFGESDAANAFSQGFIDAINSISSALPGAVAAIDDFVRAVDQGFADAGHEVKDLLIPLAALAVAFGGPLTAIAATATAVLAFRDEIAEAITGTDDFILALRTIASLGADAFDDAVQGAKDFDAFIAGVGKDIVATFSGVAEILGRTLFGDTLYDAATDFLEFLGDTFARAGAAVGAAFSNEVKAAAERAKNATEVRAGELQFKDLQFAVSEVEKIDSAIRGLSGAVDSIDLPEKLAAQIREAAVEVAKVQAIDGDNALLDKTAIIEKLKTDARELKTIFESVGVAIGEGLSQLDRPQRLELLEQLKAAAQETKNADLKGVFEGYVTQIETLEKAADGAGEALSELARKPGESFKAFAERLKATSGVIKEVSAEAGNAFKAAFAKITGEIADLEKAAAAAAGGNKEAFAAAEREAGIRVEAAQLYEKAIKAGVALTKEASEELVRQKETLIALAEFETEFGAVAVSNELKAIEEQLAAIADGGREELERVQRRQELEKQILELRLKAQAAGLSEADEVVAQLELELLDKKRKQLEDATDDLPDKGKDFVSIIDAGLNRAVGDFVDQLLDGGADFGDLFGAIFKDIARNILAGPEGIITNLISPKGQTIDLDETFDDIAKGFEKSIEQLSKAFEGISEDFSAALSELAPAIGEAFAGAAAGFAGFKLGAGLADIFTKGEGDTGGKIGGGVGGAAGFAFGGPVGAFIGSTVGSFFGKILGAIFGKPSNKFARGSFDPNTGAITGLRQKDDSEEANKNAESVRSFLDALRDGLDDIAEITGASFAKTLSLEINSRNGVVVGFGGFGPGGGPAQSQTFQNIDDALNFVVQQLVGSLTGADNQFTRLAKALAETKVPAEQLANTLATVADIAKIGVDPPSQFGQALKDLQKAFNEAANSTGNFAAAIRALADEQLEATKKLAGAFDKDIGEQLRRIIAPISQDFIDLLTIQKQRIEDAKALNKAIADAAAAGGSPPIGQSAADLAADAQARLNKVLELNTAEFVQLIESIADSPESIAQAQAAFAEFAAQIKDQTDDIAAINTALREASNVLATAFNKEIQFDIDELTNPVLFAFNQLIAKQAELEKFARTVGGDLFAVQRRNALERREFFKRLSEDEKRQLTSLGDVIEDTFGRIGVVLQETFDALDEQIEHNKEVAEEARRIAEAFRDAAKELSDTRQNLLDEFFPGSPDELLRDLLTRFDDTKQRALSGDEDAASDLNKIAEDVVALSRELNTSSPAFFATLKKVTDDLKLVQDFLTGRSDEQFAFAEAVESDIDLLKDMRDLLAQKDPSIPVLEDIRDGLSIGNVAIHDLIAELIDLVTLQNAQQAHADKVFEAMAAQAILASSVRNVTPFTPQLPASAPPPNVTVNTSDPQTARAIAYQTSTLNAALIRQQANMEALQADMEAMKSDIRKFTQFIVGNGGSLRT